VGKKKVFEKLRNGQKKGYLIKIIFVSKDQGLGFITFTFLTLFEIKAKQSSYN
jgi:hypothetical protein